MPSPNATACMDASPGTYVPTAGALSATLCPPGFYQPAAGQTACLSCGGALQAGAAARGSADRRVGALRLCWAIFKRHRRANTMRRAIVPSLLSPQRA